MSNKILENKESVHFIIWETVPQKRNENPVIKVCCSHEINSGDVLIGMYGPEGVSSYKVMHVISKRPSSMKKMEYYELHTQWRNQSPALFKSEDLQFTNMMFQRFISDFKVPTPDVK